MATNAHGVDADLALRNITLIGPVQAADLTAALSAPPKLERTIDGATTLEVDVDDHRRTLLRSGQLSVRSFAVVDRVHFELVSVKKKSDGFTLVFEDAIVAALRRRAGGESFTAGSVTRPQVARLLAGEAGVRIDVDPDPRPVTTEAIERTSGGTEETPGEPVDYWTVLTQTAGKIGWRCFSDGTGLLFGSDDWLMRRLPATSVREHAGGVHDIDFELDVGQPTSAATLDVDADAWSLPPGLPIDIVDHGPATGRWLISKYTRALTQQRATIDLVRAAPSLMEPPPSDADGERGEDDFLPDGGLLSFQAAPGTRTPAPRSARAEEQAGLGGRGRMLDYALRQVGKPYDWGASGPSEFDCSGLVQEATRAGGNILPKPSKQQWARAVRDGKTIPVAEGLRTRGAILYRGTGNPTHIAISLGDGTTVEAQGRAWGVRVVPQAGQRGWTGAIVWL